MGHRRLSILELTDKGRQPMATKDNRYILVYNGEIYNHIELREKYFKDYPFQGSSDTETLLLLLECRGSAVLAELIGMWAFAFWDRKREELLLSRDRYGQKPLYYRKFDDGSIGYASEIKPLLLESERPQVNLNALAEFLATGNYGHLYTESFYRDIKVFQPGHFTLISKSSEKISRYWRFPAFTKDALKTPFNKQNRENLRALLHEVTNCRLLSDVPVGATLSGGLDSSAIACIIANNDAVTSFPVFSAQSKDERFSEDRYVQAVIQRYPEKFRLFRKEIQQMCLSDSLEKTLRFQEEPFGDPSIIAHGFVIDIASENGIKVVLGGQGGDEVFYAYTYMLSTLIAHALRKGKLTYASKELRYLPVSIKQKLRVLLGACFPRIDQLLRRASRTLRRSWLSRELNEAHANQNFDFSSISDFQGVWLETVERVAIPHLTNYDDKNCMARSIEGRMPFLDHRLPEMLCTFDIQSFLNHGIRKYPLRRALYNEMPLEILQRIDKVGFYTPLQSMLFRESLWVREKISEYQSLVGSLCNVEIIDSLIAKNDARSLSIADAIKLWRLLVVVEWMRLFNCRL